MVDLHFMNDYGEKMLREYIDLQVNGGGGVLFNDSPSVETIERIVAAHAQHGTRTLFPTHTTDSPEKITEAIVAVRNFIASGKKGVGGIHLEGPFISKVKAGVHPLRFIRRMVDEDIELIASLGVGRTIITVAPECVAPDKIRKLVDKGVTVSLGHSNATFNEAMAAFDAGASMVTHLFNAMSQIQGREPGLVGAALSHPSVKCGVIADGHHVHYANIKMAFDIIGPDRLFLVTDSMATVGTDMERFNLYRENILVQNGRCTAKDGTLAGSALNMNQAVMNCVQHLPVSLADAKKMASPIF